MSARCPALAIASLVVASLGACGGPAQERKAQVVAPAPAPAETPAPAAPQEIVFGHFTAPVPDGFEVSPPQHEAMVLMRHEASIIFLAEGVRFPDEAAKCQELVEHATTRLVSRAAGEPIELSIQGVGTIDPGEDAPGGCWMAATGKAADGRMGYLSTALRFGPADVFVMCMSPESGDTEACKWVTAGVHESAPAR
jgi:hypothetical protein